MIVHRTLGISAFGVGERGGDFLIEIPRNSIYAAGEGKVGRGEMRMEECICNSPRILIPMAFRNRKFKFAFTKEKNTKFSTKHWTLGAAKPVNQATRPL